MKGSSKSWILGSVVVIALAMIFLPALWDQSVLPLKMQKAGQLPKPPKMAALVDVNTRFALLQQQATPQSKANALSVQAWEIELTQQYAKRSMAEQVRDKLQAQAYLAYVRASSDRPQTYRVYIGPEFKADDIDKQLQMIGRQFDLQGRRVPFKAFISIQSKDKSK